jgi:hypothetical protein
MCRTKTFDRTFEFNWWMAQISRGSLFKLAVESEAFDDRLSGVIDGVEDGLKVVAVN